MIRITRQTDYGIILLAHLAAKPPAEVHTARDVAGAFNLPLPMVSKVMKLLAREGILSSHRGVKGGYSLARNPERITVGEVIRVLEGPIGITECAFSPGSCEQETLCPVRSNWLRISAVVRDALERIPLTEMTAPSSPGLLTLAGGPLPGPSVC
jgi:FeS assembly SUF system regulator